MRMKKNKPERYDMVFYVCGQQPVREKSWIKTDEISIHYTVNRSMVATEVHIEKIKELINKVYR